VKTLQGSYETWQPPSSPLPPTNGPALLDHN
jgi:hypothetical protein